MSELGRKILFLLFLLFCMTVSFAEDISGYWTVTREIGSFRITTIDQEQVDSYIGQTLIIEENKIYMDDKTEYFTSYSILELDYQVIPTQENIEEYFDENYGETFGGHLYSPNAIVNINDQKLKYYLYIMKPIVFVNDTEKLSRELFDSLCFVSPDLLILYKGGVYFAVEKIDD